MPKLASRDITIALDMFGCPNRCRHCWLGKADRQKASEADLRWTVGQFRNFVRAGETTPFFDKIRVASAWREPDFSDDYRRLYDLECELGNEKPWRFELLSVWRLARDPSYAEWARQIGPDTCQITFFGLEETNDWFYRRKGAFRDCLAATERLLDVGMRPRWQFFFTKKILADLDELLLLADKMRLRQRVEALGGRFVLFMHTPDASGEARAIDHLRPTIDDTTAIPTEIIEASRAHLNIEHLFATEEELLAQILAREDPPAWGTTHPEHLWFLIRANWDVFTNMGTTEPWWCLGNLKRDTLDRLLDCFENDRPMGYQVSHHHSLREVARRFGRPLSRLIYGSRGDLENLWHGRYCEELMRSGSP